jgi:hypothetical protein
LLAVRQNAFGIGVVGVGGGSAGNPTFDLADRGPAKGNDLAFEIKAEASPNAASDLPVVI